MYKRYMPFYMFLYHTYIMPMAANLWNPFNIVLCSVRAYFCLNQISCLLASFLYNVMLLFFLFEPCLKRYDIINNICCNKSQADERR